MKNLTLFLLLLLANLSFGQMESPKNKLVSEEFVRHYNSDQYSSIFSMFSDTMKTSLPENQTSGFLKGLKSQLGDITSHEFVEYENGTYAVYKTTCERGVIALNISLDDESKINGFFVKPFVEEINSGKVINNLSSENNSITQEHAEIIFNNVKNFPNQTQVSIGIIEDGKVNYFGIKKVRDTISEIDSHKSIFEIGSISKVFTSTLLANAVLDEKVKLEENINEKLGIPFKNNTEISYLELANHTSGLPRLPSNLDLTKINPQNPYKNYNESALIDYITKHLELSNKGKNQYSNLGTGLLGYTLGKIENETYENLLQRKIFARYGMLHSTSDINKVKGEFVKGLNSAGKEVPNWNFSVLAGAGAILSSVEDLSLFAMAQFDNKNKELRLTREKTFTINESMDIGLAWHILKSHSKNPWYWHNGGTGGYSSSLIIDTVKKNGIIVLSNVSTFNPQMENIDKLSFALMKSLDME